MGDWVKHLQAKEPAVSNIDLNLPDRLAHTSYPVKILDERDLDQHDRIHARTAEVGRIFIFHKIVNECPVDRFINHSQKMIFRYQIIHAEHLDLFPFFICVLCHHEEITALDLILVLYHFQRNRSPDIS